MLRAILLASPFVLSAVSPAETIADLSTRQQT